MNPSKPKALIKLKYFFYSFLLKVNSNNKKFISKKIFYGSLLITAGTALLSCNGSSSERKCYQASPDSLKKYSVMKDSLMKDSMAKAAKKADSLKELRIEDSLKKDSILKSESKKDLNKKHK